MYPGFVSHCSVYTRLSCHCVQCTEFVSRMSSSTHPSSSLTLPDAPADSLSYWLVIGLPLILFSLAVLFVVMILVVRNRCRWPPAANYTSVSSDASVAQQSSSIAASPDSPGRACRESTTATGYIWHQFHRFAPTISGQMPFKGFIIPQSPV